MNILTEEIINTLRKRFNIRAIAAIAKNRVIGSNNCIPWNIPQDLQFFRKTTQGATVLMGRKTFESIGKPLPNRCNIVLSSTCQEIPGTTVICSPDQLLGLDIPRDIWVIGGATIYKLMLPVCDELYISHIEGNYSGDTYFPEFENNFSLENVLESHNIFQAVVYKRTR